MSKLLFKVDDPVKTIVSPFTPLTPVRYGVIAYIHPKESVAPYIVDFGKTWGGFSEKQLQYDFSERDEKITG